MDDHKLTPAQTNGTESVPISMVFNNGRLYITGQHGSEAASWENPAQIGLAVLVACMGQKLCPPKPWVGAQGEIDV